MGLLKKILNRNSIKDVMEALDNFKADTTSFEIFKKIASSYFGSNWKFNLEMHISSLPQNERAKYYLIFKNAIEYETATSYWTSAVQITSFKKSVSSEDLKNLANYKKYLLKFGEEGKKLYIKLTELFDIQKNKISSNDVLKSNIEIKKQPKPITTNIKSDLKSPINEEEYKKQIQKQIEEKIKSLNSGVLSSSSSIAKTTQDFLSSTKPTLKEQKDKLNITEPITAKPKSEIEWVLNNFIKIRQSLPTFRDLMSAISIYRKAKSLEEYRGYIFLVDTLDYLIEQGKKILKFVPGEQIADYFKGGVTELKQIIVSYEEEKSKEMLLMQDIIKEAEPEEKPYKNPYA